MQKFPRKFPLVSRKFWASKIPRLGEFEPKFPEEIFRALHGKFTAVVYRGKAYHGYTVVASYHIPYRLKTVQFSENRTISTIYHFVP